VLPHKTEISTAGRPKRFIAIGISIAAMAMSTFNTVQITQLKEEMSTLKEKTDLILDVVHLHKKHLPSGRKTSPNKQTTGRPCLVFIKCHRCH
jgi:hypothetical protein